MRNDFTHASNTPTNIRDLWQTPPEVYAYLDHEFNFICDVAASYDNHLHDNYLTVDYDSAKNGWSHLGKGYAFCNPPYSDIKPWIDRAVEAAAVGVGTVMVLPADTSVSWFKTISNTATEIRFITNGRLSFLRADTKKAISGNTKGTIVVIWNPYNLSARHISFLDRDFIINCEKVTA